MKFELRQSPFSQRNKDGESVDANRNGELY